MLMRQLFLCTFIIVAQCFITLPHLKAQDAADSTSQQQLTLEDAAALLRSNNNPLKIAQKGIEIATAQKQQMQSAWYPFISATGGYIHTSNKISAQANLGEMAQEIAEGFPAIGQLLPQLEQIISSLSSITLSIPLLNQNITSIDAVAIWPIVAGGKRIYATRIGRELENSAQLLSSTVYNTQMALMINTYYTLKLCIITQSMQEENLQYLQKLSYNATRLKDEGFINKAEHLLVQVALEEGQRELLTAKENRRRAESALSTILGTEAQGVPSSPFLLPNSLIPIPQEEITTEDNTQLQMLHSQEKILENKKKIAISEYIPSLSLVARQNLYSNNVPSNLLPRSMIGATLQWSIFNGLYREKEISKSRLEQEQLQFAISQAQMELNTAAISLKGRIEEAKQRINTLNLTVKLTKELLREREKGFAEGMSTSAELLEAKSSLLKAETALSLAHWEYNTSLANLLALYSNTDHFIEMQNEYRK